MSLPDPVSDEFVYRAVDLPEPSGLVLLGHVGGQECTEVGTSLGGSQKSNAI